MGQKKKPQADTSLAAYHSLDAQQVSEIKKKIMDCLKLLGKASSEEVADFLGKPYDVIWKRCSDLKNDKKIFASEYKVLTRRKRFARQWIICDGSLPKTTTTEKALKGNGIAHYSRAIQKVQFTPPDLFSEQKITFK